MTVEIQINHTKKYLDVKQAAYTIHALPKDILLIIFSYLPYQNLGVIAGVSKSWHQLSTENCLWRSVAKNFFLQQNISLENSYSLCMEYLSIQSNLKQPLKSSTIKLSAVGYGWIAQKMRYKIINFYPMPQSLYILYESENLQDNEVRHFLIGQDLEQKEKKIQYNLPAEQVKMIKLIETKEELKAIFANGKIRVWNKKQGNILESLTKVNQAKIEPYVKSHRSFCYSDGRFVFLRSTKLTIINAMTFEMVNQISIEEIKEPIAKFNAKIIGSYCCIATQKTFRIINLQTKTLTHLFDHLNYFGLYTRDGKDYFVGTDLNHSFLELYLLDCENGAHLILKAKVEHVKQCTILLDYLVIFSEQSLTLLNLTTYIKKEYPLFEYIPSPSNSSVFSAVTYPISSVYIRFNRLFVVHTTDFKSSQISVFKIKQDKLIKVSLFEGFHYIPKQSIVQFCQTKIIGYKASYWSSWPNELKVIDLTKKDEGMRQLASCIII